MDAEIKEVFDNLRIFIRPDQVTELRALEYNPDGRRPLTMAGWFDYEHLERMAEHAVKLSRHSIGVYFIPNPVLTSIKSRRENRVDSVMSSLLTKDTEIASRRWLLIDADPVRPDGISSTDAEKAAAWETIQGVRDWLWAHFDFAKPVTADSGNGYHLLLPVDWPTDDTEQAREMLNAIADEWDNDAVKIDRKVFNASRIVKLYGTTSRKGDSTAERPHRKAKVLR